VPKRKKVVRVLNCVPSAETERDWHLEHAARAGVIAAAGALPDAVDLREPWWKVGEQGSTGSCVGWAVGDGLLRWHFVKAGKLAQTDTISPRFMWMASKETDESTTRPTTFIDRAGTSIKSALDVGRKYGSVREFMLPFASAKLYAGQLETFYAAAALRKVSSYFNLGDDQARWRRWLAEQGPIATRLDVEKTWDEAKANGGNLDEYEESTTRGGHAVCLVGYTADRFIVRNSWGTGWGDGGFGYASLEYARDAFTEAYGVSI
jgi:Papain family cysteine protease